MVSTAKELYGWWLRVWLFATTNFVVLTDRRATTISLKAYSAVSASAVYSDIHAKPATIDWMSQLCRS